MEQAPRKRGRPKLFLTKEMIEERKLLKRLCKNTRRNLQVEIGETPPGEATASTLDENRGNAASDENLGSSAGERANSIGLCLRVSQR